MPVRRRSAGDGLPTPETRQRRQVILGRFDDEAATVPVEQRRALVEVARQRAPDPQDERDPEGAGDDRGVAARRAADQRDPADQLGPDRSDERRIEVVGGEDGGLAVAPVEIGPRSAREQVGDPPADIAQVRGALAEVRVVHAREEVRLLRGHAIDRLDGRGAIARPPPAPGRGSPDRARRAPGPRRSLRCPRPPDRRSRGASVSSSSAAAVIAARSRSASAAASREPRVIARTRGPARPPRPTAGARRTRPANRPDRSTGVWSSSAVSR